MAEIKWNHAFKCIQSECYDEVALVYGMVIINSDTGCFDKIVVIYTHLK